MRIKSSLRCLLAGTLLLGTLAAYQAGAAVITPVAATASSTMGGANDPNGFSGANNVWKPNNCFVQTGGDANILNWTADPTKDWPPTYGGDMWMSYYDTHGWITVDLGAAYSLQHVYLWNGMQNVGRKSKTIDVYTSPDGTTFTLAESIALSSGSTDTAVEPAQIFVLSAPNTRYVKFQVTSVNSGGNACSISAVRFDDVGGVTILNTTTTINAPTPNPSPYSGSVTISATVTPSSAVGTVNFLEGATLLGSGTLSGGVATASVSSLLVGSHVITASYLGGTAGTTNFVASAATNTVTEVITVKSTGTATTTAVTSSANPSPVASSVTLTATVSPTNATGTVQFHAGALNLGLVLITNGTASYSSPAFPIGTNVITAVYSGDATYASSTNSPAFNQVINFASLLLNYDGFSEYAVGLNDAWPNLNGGLNWPAPWYHFYGSSPVFYVTNANLAFPANSAFVGGTHALYCSDGDAAYL
ncbi:MAG: Ig-like domain repeat protein, partial [Verrucomicrobiota bacterium]